MIAIALRNKGAVVVLDDLQARRCAASMGLRILGTLGILLRAKRAGINPAARPLMIELVDSGMYLDAELMVQALAEVDE